MISLQELADHLDRYLSCPLFRDGCYNGVQVQGKPYVKRIATAVSATAAAIAAAIEWRADALIVHHGLFWDREPQRIEGSLRDKLARLLENELSLLAYHLPLDAHREVGNNWVAAEKLGLRELRPFGEYNGMSIGVQGIVEGIPIKEWVERLEAYYGQPARSALFGPEIVKSAGVISGGAHRNFPEAIRQGLHCYITGTADEPNWNCARETGTHFIAMGHAATERVGVRALAERLRSQFGCETHYFEDDNPF